MNILEQIIVAGFEPIPGATVKELAELESQTGLALPASLRELLCATNGLEIDAGGLKLMSVDESLRMWDGMREFGVPPIWGYLPIVDACDSNPFCVCCKGPLTGRVVHVFHDDAPRLEFSSVETLLAAIFQLVRQEDWDIDRLPPEYDAMPIRRSPSDESAGRELLRLAEILDDDVERCQALSFAACLLPPDREMEIIRLLKDDDMWVREDAAERLGAMKSLRALPALRELARGNQQDATAAQRAMEKIRKATTRQLSPEMKQFFGRAIGSLKNAGIAAVGTPAFSLDLGNGAAMLPLDPYFEKGPGTEVFDELVQEAKRLLGN
jgi:hypothetical protein